MRQPDPGPIDVDTLSRRVAEACNQVPEVRTAYLFGSYAQGTARADSDLDVAFDVGHEADSATRGAIKLRLIAALTDALGALGERADVMDLRRAGSSVAFRAIQTGRRVKDTSPPDRICLEVQIARRYDDDAPYRALFRQAALRPTRRLGGS